jgi:hypothetical protein
MKGSGAEEADHLVGQLLAGILLEEVAGAGDDGMVAACGAGHGRAQDWGD